MSGPFTRTTDFAPLDRDTTLAPRRSLSRFVLERLADYGMSARVECLRSTSRTFLLVALEPDVARASSFAIDHGNALSEQLLREIRESFGESAKLAGIFWRVEPSVGGNAESNAQFQKARIALEEKIRERRAARAAGQPA